MTKFEIYRDLCIEAGTYTPASQTITPEEWYAECSHNITSGMDEDFMRAANGDIRGIIDSRTNVGLPLV